MRSKLFEELVEVKRHQNALDQLERLLEMNPEDPMALYDRASLREALRGKDDDEDVALLVQHPQIEALIQLKPKAIQVFHKAVMSLIRQGKLDEAVQTARKAVRLSDRYQTMQFESYYALARAYALTAKTDRAIERDVLDSLRISYALSPRQARLWYLRDPLLAGVRADFGLSPFEAR